MAVVANPSSASSSAPPPASKPAAGGPIPAILMALVTATIVVLAWMGATPTIPWQQGYDPFGHWWLSTMVAALPVDRAPRNPGPVPHESSLRRFPGIGHGAADRRQHFPYAGQNGEHHRHLRRPLWTVPHRLDHPERYLSLSHDAAHRPLQGPAAEHDGHYSGYAAAIAADRLFFRRVL